MVTREVQNWRLVLDSGLRRGQAPRPVVRKDQVVAGQLRAHRPVLDIVERLASLSSIRARQEASFGDDRIPALGARRAHEVHGSAIDRERRERPTWYGRVQEILHRTS